MNRQQKPVVKTATHGIDRGHESRVDEASEKSATHPQAPVGPWVRPSSLDAPPPREGMVQRWIRRSVRGEVDPRNWNKSLREGWSPRPANTVPEDFRIYTVAASDDTGIIVVDDLVLCEMPSQRYAERAAYYEDQTRMQMRAVEDELERTQNKGHPILREHKSSVSHPPTVVGRRVEAADNE